MAAPLGSVWLADMNRHHTEEEQTTDAVPESLWQIGFAVTARVKKGASKPRNAPYPAEALTFHGGDVAVVTDMLNPSVVYTISSSSLPGPTKVVYHQLQHEQCGNTAWMRKPEDVKAAFMDAYSSGSLGDFTQAMSTTTFSLPWPAIADHLPNLAVDMGAWRAQRKPLNPCPSAC